METLSAGQFSLVYNAFSFSMATMAAAAVFLWLGRSQVTPAYKTALTLSGLVCAIAAYHYFRIFESWNAAYGFTDGVVTATNVAFNDAYRYVDWLLTVPLLLIELVLVMRLSEAETLSKSVRLGSAAALMIILGYPGEIAPDNYQRNLWVSLQRSRSSILCTNCLRDLARRLTGSQKMFAVWSSKPVCSLSHHGAFIRSST